VVKKREKVLSFYMHFSFGPPESGPYISNTKKIFLTRNKVKVFGHQRTPMIVAYGQWFLNSTGQKRPYY